MEQHKEEVVYLRDGIAHTAYSGAGKQEVVSSEVVHKQVQVFYK